jgi:hypothetical protein
MAVLGPVAAGERSLSLNGGSQSGQASVSYARNLIVFFRTGTYRGDLVVKGSVRRCAAKGRTVEAWSHDGNVVRVNWVERRSERRQDLPAIPN